MIISHKFRFIFIKTAKTAGTSIEVFLSPLCGERDVFTPFSEPEVGHVPRNYTGRFNLAADLSQKWGFFVEKKHISATWPMRELLSQYLKRIRYYHHIPAWQVRNRVSQEIWQQYFKFCVERNPYDKALSAWSWYNHKTGGASSLNEYLDTCERWMDSRDHAVGMWPYNYRNYVDPNTRDLLVDRIIQYDKLKDDLPQILEQLNIPVDLSNFPNAKAGMRSGQGYRTQYNNDQRKRVFELFKAEFEMHGYEF